MNYKTAAFLDVSIGKILVNLISLLPPFPKELKKREHFKNILVIKFLGIGSIIEATPLLRALKREYPDLPIDLLTFSENKHVAESLELFRNVHVIVFRKRIFNLFFQTMRFVISKRQKYSLIIDLEFFAYFSALVTKMLSSTYSLGFEGFFNSRNRCYSRTVVFDHSNHVRFIFLKFLDSLYLKNSSDIALSSLNISREKKISALQKFPSLNEDGIQIAININSSSLCTNRRWPEENFRKLIGFIQKDYQNPQIYLVGGKEDLPSVKYFFESLPDKKNIHITAGKLDILEFSFALSKMALLISSDSGPLHIAESLGIPVVGFFGPETPNLYGPLSERSFVFYRNLYCSPCLNTYNHKRSKCKDNQCLKLITTEEVYGEMKNKHFDQKWND